MASKWFVLRGAKEVGPITSHQLKQMVVAEELAPDDLVRRDDMKVATRAGGIKGLFPTQAEQGDAVPHRTRSRLPLVVAVSAGAVLLLSCCGGLGLMAVVNNKLGKTTRAEMAEGDSLWDSGNKEPAAAKYRAIIDARRVSLVRQEDRPRLFGRLIDFEFDRGDATAAKALLDRAGQDGVVPATTHPGAGRVVSGKTAPAPEKGQSRDDVVELCAAAAVGVAARDNNGANTGLDEFTGLMRSAAMQLGADKHDDTRRLLQIEPTSQKEFVTPEGVRGVVVRYSPRTTATFTKNHRTGRWQLFSAEFGDEEWNCITGIRKR